MSKYRVARSLSLSRFVSILLQLPQYVKCSSQRIKNIFPFLWSKFQVTCKGSFRTVVRLHLIYGSVFGFCKATYVIECHHPWRHLLCFVPKAAAAAATAAQVIYHTLLFIRNSNIYCQFPSRLMVWITSRKANTACVCFSLFVALTSVRVLLFLIPTRVRKVTSEPGTWKTSDLPREMQLTFGPRTRRTIIHPPHRDASCQHLPRSVTINSEMSPFHALWSEIKQLHVFKKCMMSSNKAHHHQASL